MNNIISKVYRFKLDTKDIKPLKANINVNQLDNKERVPLQYVINLKYTDEELEPIYDILCNQDKLLVNHKNVWGKTPIELAEQMSYRKSILDKLRKYE